ncbi:MAG: YceI family protein [Bacteroidales bacterium]|nr:YceI family protein [Bacteroidales bacterium]
MRITIIFFIIALLSTISADAQKFITKTGYIKFYSDAPLEKIEAHNRQVNSALDFTTGGFVFKVLMKSFEFEKALMQEHFNENYVDSDKFPSATFVGTVTNIKDVNLSQDGIYDINVDGKLTMHGVTREIHEKGTFEVKQEKLLGKAKFNLVVADYKITIPGNVGNNISNTVEVTVEITLEKANL